MRARCFTATLRRLADLLTLHHAAQPPCLLGTSRADIGPQRFQPSASNQVAGRNTTSGFDEDKSSDRARRRSEPAPVARRMPLSRELIFACRQGWTSRERAAGLPRSYQVRARTELGPKVALTGRPASRSRGELGEQRGGVGGVGAAALDDGVEQRPGVCGVAGGGAGARELPGELGI